MPRWTLRVGRWLMVLWATVFLTVSLLHGHLHNPLHSSGDCMVCVLHKTPSPEPPSRHSVVAELAPCWSESRLILTADLEGASEFIPQRPLIPRAPPTLC
ncbi:MAG: hypothetical protein RMJ83_03630 [Armatimonadota bacterium]|nr:hypothetical protein [Armatimonadota bacterium]